MLKYNHYSHRDEMRAGAAAVRAAAAAEGRTPTGDDYRRVRRALASIRRAEQARLRDLAGVSRRACRAVQPDRAPRIPGVIRALDGFFGRA